jgi:hypothetical protein
MHTASDDVDQDGKELTKRTLKVEDDLNSGTAARGLGLAVRHHVILRETSGNSNQHGNSEPCKLSYTSSDRVQT